MNTAVIDLSAEILAGLRERRTAGARVSDLAAELGVPWQRLDKLIRHGPPKGRAKRAENEAFRRGDGADPLPGPTHGPLEALTKLFQPKSLAEILGQDQAVAVLRAFAARPHPAAMLFAGGTGVGKTSAALALAAALGCDVAAREMGGVTSVASGEQTADAVRGAFQSLWYCPMRGSGWKVLVVNEADRMSTAAETIWLDALENIPGRSVIVFTTNAGALPRSEAT